MRYRGKLWVADFPRFDENDRFQHHLESIKTKPDFHASLFPIFMLDAVLHKLVELMWCGLIAYLRSLHGSTFAKNPSSFALLHAWAKIYSACSWSYKGSAACCRWENALFLLIKYIKFAWLATCCNTQKSLRFHSKPDFSFTYRLQMYITCNRRK